MAKGPDKIKVPRPDDWHVHFRQGAIMKLSLMASARCFGRCVAMPNLRTPLTNSALVAEYSEEIERRISYYSLSPLFKPLMTLYLTDESKTEELTKSTRIKNFFGVKYYPFGVTTNSSYGVRDINNCDKFLDKMQELDIPLLIHGESNSPDDDVFDCEKIFINENMVKIRERFPQLRITMEHISTKEAAQYLREAGERTAATITPQHLRYTRNHMLKDRIKPHLYCKPILKRQEDKEELEKLIKQDFPRVFLGSDSAPHLQKDKESPCGCAGVFSSPYLLEIITQTFDEMGMLETADKLINFVSRNGAKFYGFKEATEEICLVRKDIQVPAHLDLSNGERIIPLAAGEILSWSVEQ